MSDQGDRQEESPDRDDAKRHRVWLLRFLSASIGVAVAVVLAELALWLLPVTGMVPYWTLDEHNDVLRYRPNQQFVWSRGWRLRQAHLIKTNNAGFVSDTDYVKDGKRPVLAFVGDSYVEAFMVAYPATCAGRLASALERRVRVYSLGMSGAPLSEYLGYAEFARLRFDPQWLVVVVVGNDFDESLRQYRRGDQFRSFVDRDGELSLVPGRPVAARAAYRHFKRFVKRSSLVRYLVYNVQVVDDRFTRIDDQFKQIDTRFASLFETRFDTGFDSLEKKLDGLTVDHHGLFREWSEFRGEMHGRLTWQ